MLRYLLLTLLFPLLIACDTTTQTVDQSIPESPPLATRPLAPVQATPFIVPESEPTPGVLLASGLSVPDLVEKAVQSLVVVDTVGGGAGTGFIIEINGIYSVVTNHHVVTGATSVLLQFNNDGTWYESPGYSPHDTLDLVVLTIEQEPVRTAVTLGDSNTARVGEEVVIIGFPLGDTLGQEPTVSRGILSSIRDGLLQTDAPVNPGNSGGPMFDQNGNVIGIVTSKIERQGGRPVEGIGFAIPINSLWDFLLKPGENPPVQAQGAPPVVPPTPEIPPTFDLQATKDALDAHNAALQTRTAVQQRIERERQEAAQYARSLEATRIANLPTPTPVPTSTPEPTMTPLPSPTPHPTMYCREWEAAVLEWIYEGNNYDMAESGRYSVRFLNPEIPDHPQMTAEVANDHCIIKFPHGRLYDDMPIVIVGSGTRQLLPGTYEYVASGGDNRVEGTGCVIVHNNVISDPDRTFVHLEYGEPFAFRFLAYHKQVSFGWCEGYMQRIGG